MLKPTPKPSCCGPVPARGALGRSGGELSVVMEARGSHQAGVQLRPTEHCRSPEEMELRLRVSQALHGIKLACLLGLVRAFEVC